MAVYAFNNSRVDSRFYLKYITPGDSYAFPYTTI